MYYIAFPQLFKRTVTRISTSALLFSSVLNAKSFSTSLKFLDLTLSNATGIANVIINRPPVNALNLELVKELDSVLGYLEKEKITGMILSSSSDKIFSAGVDFAEVYKPSQERLTNFWKSTQDMYMHLYNTSFPTAALINGHAPGGACLISLCCEYRVMVNKFTIGLNETKVGIALSSWATSILSDIIGHRNAELALTTGKLYTTEEAAQIGLVHEVATNREDGMKKVNLCLKKFEGVLPRARYIVKRNHRERIIEHMERTMPMDLEFTVNYIMQSEYQNYLEQFLKQLKNKSSKV